MGYNVFVKFIFRLEKIIFHIMNLHKYIKRSSLKHEILIVYRPKKLFLYYPQIFFSAHDVQDNVFHEGIKKVLNAFL